MMLHFIFHYWPERYFVDNLDLVPYFLKNLATCIGGCLIFHMFQFDNHSNMRVCETSLCRLMLELFKTYAPIKLKSFDKFLWDDDL